MIGYKKLVQKDMTGKEENNAESEKNEIMWLRIDHIYDKEEYLSNIKRWLSENGLNGRLIHSKSYHFFIVGGISSKCDVFLNLYENEGVDIVKEKVKKC